MKQWKKMLSIFMSGTLLITGGVLPQKNAATAEDATDYGISNPRVEDGVTTWDKIKFGSYYQDAEVQPAEPIKWRVLSVDGDDAFLLADEILDCKQYNEENESVTWETCTLRKWLNNDFYNEAFDDEEKKAVMETVNENNNPNYAIEGGNDTKDKVYLLSIAEAGNASYGFDTEFIEGSKTREAKNTDYAKLNNGNNIWSSSNGLGYWWLRSPGYGSDLATYVCNDGDGNDYGGLVNYITIGVRPALHINLSSSKIEDAGEVNSEGNITMLDNGIGNPVVKDGVTTWDCVYFGNYRQDFSVKQDIEWRVLSVYGDDAFLLADRNLDCKRYNEEREAVTWETCTLRKWLNDDFYNETFDDEEKKAVMETTVVNEGNPSYGTDGGNDTKDKVYLLSIAEAGNVAYGFDTEFNEDSKTREAKNTDYAKVNNIWGSSKGLGCWWLRSPIDDGDSAAFVDDNGSYDGYYVDLGSTGVRPALHINLSSSSWSKAGIVSSDGQYNDEPETSPSPEPTKKPEETEKPTEMPNPTPTPTLESSAKPSPTPEKQPTLGPTETTKPTGNLADYGISNPRVKDGVTTWDKIKFGSYYQDAELQPAEPIKWRVLSVDGDDAFLLADKNLDCKPYNEELKDMTWETCTLRKWLNEDFYNEAFDDEERKAIIETTVVNEDNTNYGTESGNNTTDKVYLLSIAEACNEAYGLFDEYSYTKTRLAKNTDYAKVKSADGTNLSNTTGYDCWWLRSSGSSSDAAAYVNNDGRGIFSGLFVSYSYHAVRPVLHINLSSPDVEDAGEVDSEGNVTKSADGIKAPRMKDGVIIWDCVYFGNYRQSCTFEKKALEWRILSVDGDDAFLLADKNIDVKPYNEENADVTWETCTLRKWLNEDFYNDAFDDEEKEAVKETKVVNENNLHYDTEGGNDTTDKLYLLSIAEAYNAAYGFEFDATLNYRSETRKVMNTDYVKVKDAYSSNLPDTAGNGYWWLRSPGDISSYATFVDYYGIGMNVGASVNLGVLGVRPVLHINLSSSSWSKAGIVSSDGQYNNEPETSPLPEPTKKPEEAEKPTGAPKPTPTPNISPSPSPDTKPSPTPGNMDNSILKEESSLQITPDGKLTGLIQNRNTVLEIRNQFDTENLVIRDIKGKELKDTDLLGTGATISIVENGEVKASCQAVLAGDINGDGEVIGKDVSLLARSIVGKETLSEVQKAAGELIADGEINGKDVSRLAQSVIGKATISSSKPK